MPDTPAPGLHPRFSDRWTNLLILVLLAGAGFFMASISWLKWPDLLIDYGDQVYIPWRLSEGLVLYKDIFYMYGPLSSYIHVAGQAGSGRCRFLPVRYVDSDSDCCGNPCLDHLPDV